MTKRPIVLIKQLKKYLKVLKREYTKCICCGTKDIKSEWLCDNFYLIESNGKQILKELKKTQYLPQDNKLKLPLIYLFCEQYLFLECKILKEDQILLKLEESNNIRELQSNELDFISIALKITIIKLIYQGVMIFNIGSGDSADKVQAITCIGNAISSLRDLASFDFEKIVEEISSVELIFNKDPAGVYPKMDKKSKNLYRSYISEFSRDKKISEGEAAQKVLVNAQNGKTPREKHIGSYILGYRKNIVKNKGKLYIGFSLIIPIIITIALCVLLRTSVFILAFLPLWEVFKPIFEFIFMKNVPISYFPRIELNGEIPSNAKTAIVISTIVSNPKQIPKLKKHLERLYFSNIMDNLCILVLADLKQADTKVTQEDEINLNANIELFESLNKKYDNHFYFVVRKREFSPVQNSYSGRERKRGALNELVNYIKGEECDFAAFVGDEEFLRETKYLLALDSDTNLLIDTAADLVSVAIHPLNKPEIDREKKAVINGYGIFAPKVETELYSTSKTSFASIMAGTGGVTAYEASCGELYQDLFGEGIFAGKGLIDVDAFYECCTTLPDNIILSHDILEGGILRTCFISDTIVSDAYPPNANAYFARLHRWIRGDWQNLIWLFKKVPTNTGKKVKNPLNSLSKYKLFDNLRRSITPIFSFLCIALAFFIDINLSIILSMIGLLAVIFPFLFSAFRSFLGGGISMVSRLYYSNVLPQSMLNITQGAINLVLLFTSALKAADAIIRTLWRLLVSHKRLLEWTTAAQTDKLGSGLVGLIQKFGLQTLIGILMFVFAPYSYLRIFGLIFVLVIPIFYFTGKIRTINKREVSDKTAALLKSWSAQMWDFYDKLCTEEDNYLPPDNLQEAPVYAVAHRTSPTNIGLYMLSILAARDFGFIDTESMVDRLSKTVETVEKMAKYEGNLYNWYDTRTLELLRPEYVSTVDSGNFICCIVALIEGLKEYESSNDCLSELILRIEKIVKNTNLSIFFNNKRKLFSIGVDPNSQKLTNSYYDLLISESRMTSFYAIAKRQVTKKHWGRLSRTLASDGRYTGPISWTGTMFEYFMPQLLMPVYENSLVYEALKFCIYSQRKRTKRSLKPWGISESAFFAFDGQLNYQYKAHGVQKLGLKRGLNEDLVVSPYSSFLVLPFDELALENLKRLEDMGMIGRFGFFEAIDFTKSRVGVNGSSIIKSYMAHHVGMSLISVYNLLFDNKMQERFMKDMSINAATELLEEKIPIGAVVFDDFVKKEPPKRTNRIFEESEEYDKISPIEPRVQVLSNNEFTTVIADNGCGYSTFREINLFRSNTDLLRDPLGIFVSVGLGDNFTPITVSPDYTSKAKRSAEFGKDYASFFLSTKELEAAMQVTVCGYLPCEIRRIAVKNTTSKRAELKTLLYLEPMLSTLKQDKEHTAFSRLFVEAHFDEVNRILFYRRRLRDNEKEVFLGIGFEEDNKFSYETVRYKALKRQVGISEYLKHGLKQFSAGAGTPDAIAAIIVKSTILPKQREDINLLISAGQTKDEVISNINTLRTKEKTSIKNNAPSMLIDNTLEGRIAFNILPKILYNSKDSNDILSAVSVNTGDVKSLWTAGISGDFPIVLVELNSKSDITRLEVYLMVLKRLRICSIIFDLVVLYNEGGTYGSPVLKSIEEAVEKEGLTSCIGNAIFPLNMQIISHDIIIAVKASACHIVPKNLNTMTNLVFPYNPIKINSSDNSKALVKLKENISKNMGRGLEVEGGYFYRDRFYVTGSPVMPWCHILANKTFGTLVSDRSLGFSWAVNARENKLTPFSNDVISDNIGEMLILKIGNSYYDLLKGSLASFSPLEAIYEGNSGEIQTKVTVSVGEKSFNKFCQVELTNNLKEAITIELAYYLEPVLGRDRGYSKYVVPHVRDKKIVFTNHWNTSVESVMTLSSSIIPNSIISSKEQFFNGRWSECSMVPNPNPCGCIIIKRELPPKRKEKVNFVLSWASNEKSSMLMSKIKDGGTRENTNEIKIETPDKALNEMINTWLPWQTLGSRIFGRTGFYQCGGAYGFRDQLQDCCAVLLLNPKVARTHILRAASTQFREGDVLHWWHQLSKGVIKGVRTRHSDNLIWLPYTVCEYIEKTNDTDILNSRTPYIDGDLLKDDEHERFFTTFRSKDRDSVYIHCKKALDKGYNVSPRNIPLIGIGDWNDGFNNIGKEGQGESVWLGLFLALTLERFIKICDIMHDDEYKEICLERIQKLKDAVDEHCYDGEWYLRAFYDDKSPVGSKINEECFIDSLPQSFAVFANMPDKQRVNKSLDSVLKNLIDYDQRIVKLFTLPYNNSEKNPGYVKAYPPGIRENGGQYTHAAIWFAMALIKFGRYDEGYEVLKMLNPAARCMNSELAEKYMIEPYYIAADIYTTENAYGRGGWSLYTGAAAWYYRTVIEDLIGIKVRGDKVFIDPKIPKQWDKFKVSLKLLDTNINIEFKRADEKGVFYNSKEIEFIELDSISKDIVVNY